MKKLPFQIGESVRRGLFLLILVAGGLIQPATYASEIAQAAPMESPAPGSAANFYKLTINQSGMVAVTYETLAAAHLPVDTLDPTTFQVFEQGSEIARRVVDADGNGRFNAGDAILFYGRAVDTFFTGVNVYWLTYGAGPGLDFAVRAAAPQAGLPQATTFTESLHLEQNLLWMKSIPLTGQADRWYWNLYRTTCGSNIAGKFAANFDAPGVAAGAFSASLTPRVRGFNDANHTAIFDLNATAIGQATFANKDEYLGVLTFDQALLLGTGNTLTLTAPCPTTTTTDWGLVNWYDVRYQRTYAAPAGQFPFAVEGAAPVGVTVTGLTDPATAIYDITDPQHPQALTGVAVTPGAAYNLAFAHTSGAPARYIAASAGQFLAPTSITPDAPSSLRSPAQGADWIIISHSAFLPEAQRLALHRQTALGLRTAVVDVQDVYDEFNGGLMDQEAIRSFLRYAYETWPRPAPRYAVLLGDGHYDPRNILKTNAPYFIPPYLAAVNPFDGVTAADNRFVAYDPIAPATNPVPFMSLGRLPANTLADAQAMVSKIIAYETAPLHADWNLKTLFIADDADTGGPFPEHSDLVADSTYYLPAEYDRQKVYYKVNYTTSADAKSAIIAAINAGRLFVNYNGHASAQNWSGEPLLALSDLSQFTNTGKYAIFLPMTCLEGDYVSPTIQSFGESVVRLPLAGAVASWSPTGKGVANGHTILAAAFYEAIFQRGVADLGTAILSAKQVFSTSGSPFQDLLDTYVLFGDPATVIDLPSPDAWVRKEVTPATSWQPGQVVTYTITYGNQGSALASGVRITDTLPAELHTASWTAGDPAVVAVAGTHFAWQVPDLAPGAQGAIQITATIAEGLPPETPIINTAVIGLQGQERPGRGANDTSQVVGTTQTASLYSLTGRAFIDSDWNGVFTPAVDSPVPNLPIAVRDATNVLVASLFTDSEGRWSTLLPAGAYTVTVPGHFAGLVLASSPTVSAVLGQGGGQSGAAADFAFAAPTGLEIEYARGIWLASGARIEWATRIETNVAAFNLYRTADPTVRGKKINLNPILPTAPPDEGATYRFDDLNVTPNTTTYYWLQVTLLGGDEVWVGPFTPAWKTRLRLPMILFSAPV